MQQPWGPIFLSPYKNYDLQPNAFRVINVVTDHLSTMTLDQFEEILKEDPEYLPFFGGRCNWAVMDVLLLPENPRMELVQHLLTTFPSIPPERIINNFRHSRDRYHSPLMTVVAHPNEEFRREATQLFLENGGSPNYCNQFGETALSRAFEGPADPVVLDLLFKYGAVFPASLGDLRDQPFDDPYYEHSEYSKLRYHNNKIGESFKDIWGSISPGPPPLQKLIADVIREKKINTTECSPLMQSWLDYQVG